MPLTSEIYNWLLQPDYEHTTPTYAAGYARFHHCGPLEPGAGTSGPDDPMTIWSCKICVRLFH